MLFDEDGPAEVVEVVVAGDDVVFAVVDAGGAGGAAEGLVDGGVGDGGLEGAFGEHGFAVDLAHGGVVDEVVLGVDGGHLDALFQFGVEDVGQDRFVEVGHHHADRVAGVVEDRGGHGPADVALVLDR